MAIAGPDQGTENPRLYSHYALRQINIGGSIPSLITKVNQPASVGFLYAGANLSSCERI